MATLTIPYPDFVSGTTIVSQQVDDNNAAIYNYINARDAGSANWGAVSTIGAFTSTLTSNQIILGTTRTITLTAPTPATTSRVYTVPDVSVDSSFVMLHGAQGISGAKTFDNLALKLQETGGSDTVSVAIAALATSRTYTLPDAGTNASFVMTEGAQTINGALTFTAQLFGAAGSNTAPTFAPGTATMGMYRSAANTIGFATNSVLRVTIDANGDLSNVNGTFRAVGSGSASFPDFSFTGDTNSGLRTQGADLIALTTGGVDALTISAAQQVALGSGSAATNVRINTQTTTGASTATMTNSPTVGNPVAWIVVNINGTDRKIPVWA